MHLLRPAILGRGRRPSCILHYSPYNKKRGDVLIGEFTLYKKCEHRI